MRRLLFLLALAPAACGKVDAPETVDPPGTVDPVDTVNHPDWHERTVLALTNAVRIAPADWKARWSTRSLPANVLSAAYPAVAPIRWNAQLGASSLAHSRDMATHGCFSHDSCDGTSIWTRIKSYYSLSGNLGENIAAGYGDPMAVMVGWICDETNGACCADGQSCDGHRRSIMASGWQALGVGWASNTGSAYGQYWTQDFGGVADGEAQPLADGSHLIDSGSLRFFANYWAGDAPRSVTLVLAGQAVPMAVALGAAAKGTWSVEAAGGSSCRPYHFEAVDAAGRSWRYPATGELVTFLDAGCTEFYRP